MRRLLAIGVLACTTPRTASAEVCSPEYLLLSPDPASVKQSRLEVAVAAGLRWDEQPADWPAAQDWARLRDRTIDELAMCTVIPEALDDAAFGTAARSAWKPFEETVKEAIAEAQPTSPVLTPILGSGGAPDPHFLQVGLSQVVTAGQPGFSGTVSGHFDQAQRASLLATALVIQPTHPTDSMAIGPAEPKLASFDAGFVWTTRPNVHTFLDWLSRDRRRSTAFAARSWAATLLMVSTLKADLLATPGNRHAAVTHAVMIAGESYRDSTRAYIVENYVKVEEGRNRANYFDITVRLRATRDATFLPELPDLLAATAAASGAFGTSARPDRIAVGLTSTAALSASALPTEDFATWDGSEIGSTLGGVGDLAIGAMMALPTGVDRPPTRVTASGIGRASWHDGANEDKWTLSAGGQMALNVPIGSGIELVGTYVLRYIQSFGWASTSGFTVSKSID
jgi:hypothetical protein